MKQLVLAVLLCAVAGTALADSDSDRRRFPQESGHQSAPGTAVYDTTFTISGVDTVTAWFGFQATVWQYFVQDDSLHIRRECDTSLPRGTASTADSLMFASSRGVLNGSYATLARITDNEFEPLLVASVGTNKFYERIGGVRIRHAGAGNAVVRIYATGSPLRGGP